MSLYSNLKKGGITNGKTMDFSNCSRSAKNLVGGQTNLVERVYAHCSLFIAFVNLADLKTNSIEEQASRGDLLKTMKGGECWQNIERFLSATNLVRNIVQCCSMLHNVVQQCAMLYQRPTL